MAISSSTINQIREAKTKGYSLAAISKRFEVAKSTASLYCRDFFCNSQRIYQTEAIARFTLVQNRIALTHKCEGCSREIRKARTLCRRCYDKQRTADNPICPQCGIKTHKKGFSRNNIQYYLCRLCGHHYVVAYGTYCIRLRKRRIREAAVSRQDFEAIFANNTGIDTIDDLTRNYPLSYRSDLRQDVALRCFEFGLDINNRGIVAEIVRDVARKYRNEERRKRFGTISLYSKPFGDSKKELWQTIADPSADFVTEIENREVLAK